ncbi:pectate lyase [Streptomyces sp. NPDC052727]|uniref:pectate lyase n=1 Tax=Streptomyces sp. NPDC052727 TaxID=3154854 RepID=UPI003426E58A
MTPSAPARRLLGGLATLGLTLDMIMTLRAPAGAATRPGANGSQAVSATISLSGTKDYGMRRLYGTGDLGSDSQDEDQGPLLELAPGTVLKNVISVYTLSGGGAKEASDKVFRFNGAGTLNVSGFAVRNFGTFARSCGNCKKQYKRTINLSGIEATYKGSELVGINTDYGDSATLKNVTIVGDTSKKIVPCQKYIGDNTGKEPTTNGSGPDGTYCQYSSSDITCK